MLVEGEFGTVVPITRLLEQPFQNWTRDTAKLVGPIKLDVDYGATLDDIRGDFERFVCAHPPWDKRAQVLQFVDLTDRVVVVRALVSAANAGDLFDPQCAVRSI